MDKFRDSILRSLAASLARDLAAGEAAVADLLQRFELPQLAAAAPPAAATGTPGRIGIWEPRADGATRWLERAPELAGEFEAWADVQRLRPKGARKRVVLVGESVARGFLYDPQYTPAAVLQGLLDSVLGEKGARSGDGAADAANGEAGDGAGGARAAAGGKAGPGGSAIEEGQGVAGGEAGKGGGAGGEGPGVEVIDLARTGLAAQGLGELLVASLALQPDALVIFAGNNWNLAPAVFDDGLERHLVAGTLRQRGVAGLKAYSDAKLVAMVERGVEAALGMLATRVPIVLVIPEFNLGDWQIELAADAPWLGEADNVRWSALAAQARAALAAGQPAEAEAHARAMVEIDRGTAATGFVLLAQLARQAGRTDEARALLERARDAHSWDNAMQVPRTLGPVQEALRRSAAKLRLGLVDLPRIFQQALGGELPDRRLFLDYCHMSSQGIRIAMAAAAELLLPLLGAAAGAQASRDELLARAAAPAPDVEGEACFAAAIHNAHWGQPYGIVRHLCDRALACSPRAAGLMRDYVDLEVRRAPAWACAAAESLRASGATALSRLILWTHQIGEEKLLDAVLLDAIADALEAAGTPARSALDRLRLEERGLAAGGSADLLDAYHLPSWVARERLWESSFFYQAYAPVSRFPLIGGGAGKALSLRLTWRQPAGGADAGPGAAAAAAAFAGAVTFNGQTLAELPVGEAWESHTVVAPGELVRDGVNWIEVRWPLRLGSAAAALGREAGRIEKGQPYCLLPAFGEIHSFRAALA